MVLPCRLHGEALQQEQQLKRLQPQGRQSSGNLLCCLQIEENKVQMPLALVSFSYWRDGRFSEVA